MATLQRAGLLLMLATSAYAQGVFSGFGGNGSPFSSSGDDDSSSSSSSSSSGSSSSGYGGSNFGGGGFDFSQYASRGRIIIIAHAVLGTAAFGFFFPLGGILIRVGSFRGLWIVHGLLQMFAYLLYIAAFAIGIWMTRNYYTLNAAHPIIGIVLMALIFFQPFLGFAHHVMFKKHSRRTVWSYGHIWLGRIVITLGIVNGGLGLELAQRTRVMAPSNGAVIGYSVGAGVMWLLYMLAVMHGESKRKSVSEFAPPPKYKYHSRHNSYGERGMRNGEYYKTRPRTRQYA